jgi:hypothetical protein
MKQPRLGVRIAGLLALLASTAGLVSTVVHAQGDPHVGTWVLNVNRSKYTPGPPPRGQTSIYTADGQSFKIVTKGVGTLGQPTTTEFTAAFDGKDHPVRGNADYDSLVAKRIDANTIEYTRKKGGKQVQTAISAVSKDGKVRTVTSTGVNARGEKVNIVAVYDRK